MTGSGLIYEYFLGKFAFAEGQKGGEFFTPTSIVRLIVEILEPFHGKIYDPACGTGGCSSSPPTSSNATVRTPARNCRSTARRRLATLSGSQR